LKKIVLNIISVIGLIFALFLVIISGILGKNIPIADQIPILRLLVTISSIVFGLMGVWLAVIYADSLETIFDSELSSIEKKDSIKNFRYLSKPMIVAAVIITYVLLFNFMYPLLHQLTFLKQFYLEIRSISFVLISLLTLAQVWTIIYIFAPAENIKNKAKHQVEKQARNEQITKNTKSVNKK
jgi:hypothetical protein